MAALSPTTEQDRNLALTVHKLKLQWMMAKTDEERRRVSEQIRKTLNPPKSE